LHEAPAAVTLAVAGLAVAQVRARVVEAEGRAAGGRVELGDAFGNRHEALGLGADGAQRAEDHRPVGELRDAERGLDVGQVARDVRRLGGGEQFAHVRHVEHQFERAFVQRDEIEQHLAARPDDAIADEPDAGLPFADGGIEVVVDRCAGSGERCEQVRVAAQGFCEGLAQPFDVFADAAFAHQDVHAASPSCGP
jgi:hypothetical protein